ncbi:MAG: hypothetical protein OEY38_21740 [Gammaproteobacteria bacterium]|nr:hypothetical protein [Gammaproteobacteria bacterium]
MGTTGHSVYEPDPVPPVSTGSQPRSRKQPWFKGKSRGSSVDLDGGEALKNAHAKPIALLAAIISALAFFIYTINDFATPNQGGIVSALVFVVVYFNLSKPLRGVTLAVVKLVGVTAKVIGSLFKFALWIAVIVFIGYVIKAVL